MDNGYKPITDGNLKQGDEYRFRGSNDWRQIMTGFDTPCLDGYEYRRPVAQDEPKSYASDTKPVVDNLSSSELPDSSTISKSEAVEWVPPVGVECEFNQGGDNPYKKCLIAAHHVKTGRPIVDHCDVTAIMTHAPECWKFRPIQPEQTEREKLEADFTEFLKENSTLFESSCPELSKLITPWFINRLKGEGDE